MSAPITPSAWIYLVVALLTIVDAFVALPHVSAVTAMLIVAFAVIEFGRTPRAQKVAGVILITVGVGCAAAAAAGRLEDVFLDGISRTRFFVLLFFAVSWLQIPANASPALRAARSNIVTQPPGRRFVFLSVGTHVLGAVLNLAGLSLLSKMVENQSNRLLRRRLTIALIQGFTSASCWSPFFVSMVVVLVAFPTLQWRDVGPAGLVSTALILLGGWAYDRIVLRTPPPRSRDTGPAPISRGQCWRVFAILASLSVLIIGFVEGIGVTIPVALGILGPPYAFIWYAAIGGHSRMAVPRMRELAGGVMSRLPTLRSEVMVFLGANMLGVGVAAVVPSETLGALIEDLLPHADLKIAFILAASLVLGMTGFHPVIFVIIMGEVLPPEAFGLPDWIMGLAFLSVWGLSTTVSPVSATTLYLSRISGEPPHVIAWRWAPAAAFIGVFLVFAWLVFLRRYVG